MLAVISPAKTLDFDTPHPVSKPTQPEFLDDAEALVKKLRRMSRKKLGALMDVSPELADLNAERYERWSRPFTARNAKAALFAFAGEVYTGLDAAKFRKRDLDFAQGHLRILSGLYGVLRPFDLMQPYRLEMGTRFATRRGKTLYDFWGERITEALNAVLADHKHPVLVNLASNEYIKSVKRKTLHGPVVTPVFKEIKNGKSRTIATFAKQARGRMAAWMIRERIDEPDRLREFAEWDYEYVAGESSDAEPVFTRPQPPPVRSSSSPGR